MAAKPRIAIIGAGPIGLEAALYARLKGFDVTVYERGRIAENVGQWGHVRMFSPFGMNASEWGRKALQEAGQDLPASDALLTGAELAQAYLLPLSQQPAIRFAIRERHCVTAIARQGRLKHECVGMPQRSAAGFQFCVNQSIGDYDSKEFYDTADVVLDCGGTWTRPRNMGPGGLACIGEDDIDIEMRINYWPMGPTDAESSTAIRFLLVGSGHSAATSALALTDHARRHPLVRVLWLTRRDAVEPIWRIENDQLPERDRIASLANELALSPNSCVDWRPGWIVVRIEADDSDIYEEEPLVVTIQETATGVTETLEIDSIIANVGYRPDRSLYEELQVQECYATQGPMKLAAKLLGETSADCLDQTSYGAEVLRNPEPNFYILGMKSYGRNSNFLIQIGLQQIVDVFSLIEQDWGLS